MKLLNTSGNKFVNTLHNGIIKMDAEIILVNSERGMYKAQSDNGEFVVFELLDSYKPEMGDIKSHPGFYSMGGETYTNVTQETKFEVYVQKVCSSLDQAKRQCLI